jgi:hypothetical protein
MNHLLLSFVVERPVHRSLSFIVCMRYRKSQLFRFLCSMFESLRCSNIEPCNIRSLLEVNGCPLRIRWWSSAWWLPVFVNACGTYCVRTSFRQRWKSYRNGFSFHFSS